MRIWISLGLLLVIGACSDRQTDNIEPGPDQIIRLSDSEIKGLDPQKISDLSSLRVAADQFEGLTRMNAQGEAEPGLARAWEVSADGLEWEFQLRTKLQFSDGTRIDGTLFPAIFNRLRDPQTAAPAKALFDNIISISAGQQDSVTIRLKAPKSRVARITGSSCHGSHPFASDRKGR